MNADKALAHVGHHVVVVTYGSPPVNVAVECEDCGVVIADCDLTDEPCESCGGSGLIVDAAPEWLAPPEGWRWVERCDLCDRYADDLEAAGTISPSARWATPDEDHRPLGAHPRAALVPEGFDPLQLRQEPELPSDPTGVDCWERYDGPEGREDDA